MRYKVMVSLVYGDDTYEEEYTGIIHNTYEDARKEFLKAKSDGWALGADSVYIKKIEE